MNESWCHDKSAVNIDQITARNKKQAHSSLHYSHSMQMPFHVEECSKRSTKVKIAQEYVFTTQWFSLHCVREWLDKKQLGFCDVAGILKLMWQWRVKLTLKELDRFGPIWTDLDRFGPIWTNLDQFGPGTGWFGPIWTGDCETLPGGSRWPRQQQLASVKKGTNEAKLASIDADQCVYCVGPIRSLPLHLQLKSDPLKDLKINSQHQRYLCLHCLQ